MLPKARAIASWARQGGSGARELDDWTIPSDIPWTAAGFAVVKSAWGTDLES
jgi:hypothetical protein